MIMRELLIVVVRDKLSLHALRKSDLTSCNSGDVFPLAH